MEIHRTGSHRVAMSKTTSMKHSLEHWREGPRAQECARFGLMLNFGLHFNGRKLLTEGHVVNHESGSQPWLHRQAGHCSRHIYNKGMLVLFNHHHKYFKHTTHAPFPTPHVASHTGLLCVPELQNGWYRTTGGWG